MHYAGGWMSVFGGKEVKRPLKAPSTLFLHGGPGASSRVERLWIKDLAHIDWWDQPRPAADDAMAALLRAVEDKLRRCADAFGGPVHLLSSSFGCELAVHLLRCMPARVSSLVMLAPVFDVPAAFAGLARAQLARTGAETLAPVLSTYRQLPSRTNFWALLEVLLASRNLFDCYWGAASREKMDAFVALLGERQTFDFASFRSTLDDFLIPRADGPVEFRGPVTAVLGSCDPLVDPATAIPAIRLRFPEAGILTVKTGHFPHLEVSSDMWEPEQLHRLA
ncbi:alpha/beta fold hydrolase [Massilia aerilata]|uniref:Alpha/beta fold hydrolase n=1 Tax=Massilia aerilata TaxID=453817 RepID=A0ABW0RS57_9BURK